MSILKRIFGELLGLLVFLLACVVEVLCAIPDVIRDAYQQWQGVRIKVGWRKRDFVGKYTTHRIKR